MLAGLCGIALTGVAAFFVHLSEWARRINSTDVSSELVVTHPHFPDHAGGISPRRVEQVLGDLVAQWAWDLQFGLREATVLVHPQVRDDFDIRIINDDSDSPDGVCLVQVKARPVLSTVRRLARTMKREGAVYGLIVASRPPNLRNISERDLDVVAARAGIRIGTPEKLPGLIVNHAPTVEVYRLGRPPWAPTGVLIQ